MLMQLILLGGLAAAGDDTNARLDAWLEKLGPKLVATRRQLHEHPELSNREEQTSALVEARLKELGVDEVQRGMALWAVTGVIRGAQPGPMVALRADMDALPVVEQTDLPFASRVRAKLGDREVGVMHACGHDVHTTALLGAAEVLMALKAELKGSVLLIFQPAEEGAPSGEEGGAKRMLKEGLLAKHHPQ